MYLLPGQIVGNVSPAQVTTAQVNLGYQPGIPGQPLVTGAYPTQQQAPGAYPVQQQAPGVYPVPPPAGAYAAPPYTAQPLQQAPDAPGAPPQSPTLGSVMMPPPYNPTGKTKVL